MKRIRIHYYDPEIVTAPDDKGAWRSLVSPPLTADLLAQPPKPGEDEKKRVSLLEERRIKWVQALFPVTLGKTVVTVVFDAEEDPTIPTNPETSGPI